MHGMRQPRAQPRVAVPPTEDVALPSWRLRRRPEAGATPQTRTPRRPEARTTKPAPRRRQFHCPTKSRPGGCEEPRGIPTAGGIMVKMPVAYGNQIARVAGVELSLGEVTHSGNMICRYGTVVGDLIVMDSRRSAGVPARCGVGILPAHWRERDAPATAGKMPALRTVCSKREFFFLRSKPECA